jgi:ribose transport system permease protein
MVGALIIVVVQNGLNLNAVPTSWQNITLGAIIAMAVLIDMWRSDLGRAVGHWFGRTFRRGQASKDGAPGPPAANRPR